jgi:TPP-dependent pyruvate/acetoin dehydrogenase alpha subunit
MLEKFFLEHDIMSKLEMDQIRKTISEEVEEAVNFARESPYPDENDLLQDVFKR